MKTVGEIVAEKKAAREEQNLAALANDIQRARDTLLIYYPRYINEEETPTGLFDPKIYCHVCFPDVDRATVMLVKFGEPMPSTTIEFRLLWQHGRLLWVGDIVLRRELLGKSGEIKLFAGLAKGKP